MGVAMINYPFAIIAVIYVGSFTYLYLRCRDRLPFHKYLSNHVLLFAPLNFLFTYFTTGRQGPCLKRNLYLVSIKSKPITPSFALKPKSCSTPVSFSVLRPSMSPDTTRSKKAVGECTLSSGTQRNVGPQR